MWDLRRPERSGRLFDELTMDEDEQTLRRAITAISQSDPLIKLLQQVVSGRMRPGDPGLRAITESWLDTYQRTIASAQFSRGALRRIDPCPRLARLTEAGILSDEHPSITSLRSEFDRLFQQAVE